MVSLAVAGLIGLGAAVLLPTSRVQEAVDAPP
jgi:hypothetical protein